MSGGEPGSRAGLPMQSRPTAFIERPSKITSVRMLGLEQSNVTEIRTWTKRPQLRLPPRYRGPARAEGEI